MQRKLVLTSLTAILLTAAQVGSAQEVDINPDLGYYYWNLSATQGRENRTLGGDINNQQKWEFNTTRMEYVYDFCGKVDSFIGFSFSRQTQSHINSDNTESTSGVRERSKFAEIYFGHHWRSNDFADVYFKVGQIRAEDHFATYWGKEFETRGMFELGFRSRVGNWRNLELVHKTRYDELYRLQTGNGLPLPLRRRLQLRPQLQPENRH